MILAASDPPPDSRFVIQVLLPESIFKESFFTQDEIITDHEAKQPYRYQSRDGARQYGHTQQYQNHAQVHRVACKSVKTTGDQHGCLIKRNQAGFSLFKCPRRTGCDADTQYHRHDSGIDQRRKDILMHGKIKMHQEHKNQCHQQVCRGQDFPPVFHILYNSQTAPAWGKSGCPSVGFRLGSQRYKVDRDNDDHDRHDGPGTKYLE